MSSRAPSMNLADLGALTPEPVAPASSPPRRPLSAAELAGQVGLEVATRLSSALERVNLLATTGKIGRRSLRSLRAEIEQARRAAMTGQQIHRLASGRVRAAPEPLDLPRLLQEAVDQRARELEARGLEVHKTLKPVWASADATLGFALVQALLDWAFEHCCERLIQVGTELRNWPVRVQLSCEFAWRPADQIDTQAQAEFEDLLQGPEARPLDTLSWSLIEHLAVVMGVKIEREDSAWRTRVLLEFPRAAEGEAATTPLTGGEAGSTLNSKPLAGCHLLVVSGRREVRNLLREALKPMGMMVDFVTSQDTAREFCRGGVPHAVIFDAALGPLEALRKDLRELRTLPPFVEISEELDSLQVANRGSRVDTRVGLNAVAVSLRGALEYTLGR